MVLFHSDIRPVPKIFASIFTFQIFGSIFCVAIVFEYRVYTAHSNKNESIDLCIIQATF